MDSPARPARRARLVRLMLLAVLALTCGGWLLMVLYSLDIVPIRGTDFAIYYGTARALRLQPGADIYGWPALAQSATAPGACALMHGVLYVYPPLLALLMEPLSLLPCDTAMHVWALINAGCWAVSTALLARYVSARWPARRLLAVTLTVVASFCFWHAYWGFWLGQVHILVLCGIALALYLMESRRPMAAGAVLAFVALIKFFPAFLVGYYLLRGRWRVVAGAALATVLLTGVMLAAVGPAELARSVPAAFSAVRYQVVPGENEALAVALPVVGPALAGLVALLFCVGLWRMWRRGEDAPGYAWALCTLMLVSPLIWSFYLIWLLPVFAVCLGIETLRSRWLLALLFALYVVIALPGPQVLRPLATLALWIVTGVLFVRSARSGPTASDPAAKQTRTPAPPLVPVTVPVS